jgi:hypothetical protein
VPDNNGSGPYARPSAFQRAVVLGYILAFALPPLGFATGVVLMLAPRLRSKHGIWIVLLSIAAGLIWALLIGAGALKDTNQGY